MNIIFEPLSRYHFPLLLKWLQTEHIKKWWDRDVEWTTELIREKYEDYTKGCKLEDGLQKKVEAFVIRLDNIAIGYIQYYNKHDFPDDHSYPYQELPKSCAGFDYYIGEPEFIGHGIGSKVLITFLQKHILTNFDYIFASPETANIAAINAYKKAGFSIIKKVKNEKITLMIRNKACYYAE